jgi:predicted metalloprotease with PDZ domain
VKADQIGERLRDYAPNESVSLTFFHQDELKTSVVALTEARSSTYQLVLIKESSSQQQNYLRGWLGETAADL